MRLTLLFAVLLVLLGLWPNAIQAQATATTLEALDVAFWPDFDRPSVLVLLTGTLPEDAAFPVEVAIPIPARAELNAVASVEPTGMISLPYTEEGNAVVFSATAPEFRVEYYAPYDESADGRSYDFAWNSDLGIGEVTARVQQPANATSLVTEPEATSVETNPTDGLTYHALPARPVPAGTPFAVSFRYTATGSGLTLEELAGPQESNAAPVAPATGGSATTGIVSGANWPLILAGLGLLLLAIGGTWFVARRTSTSGAAARGRQSKRPRKPAPAARVRATSTARFCHVCGRQAEADDRFCRQCGSELKTL